MLYVLPSFKLTRQLMNNFMIHSNLDTIKIALFTLPLVVLSFFRLRTSSSLAGQTLYPIRRERKGLVKFTYGFGLAGPGISRTCNWF